MSDQQPSQPAGWYHAQGDPPGTNRFWDGYQWQGGPQAAGATAAPGNPAAGFAPGFGASFTEGSQATTALVLGILSFVCCGLLGPVAWYVGQQELNGIDSGRRNPTNRGTANAGRICGMVATALLALIVVLYTFAIVGVAL